MLRFWRRWRAVGRPAGDSARVAEDSEPEAPADGRPKTPPPPNGLMPAVDHKASSRVPYKVGFLSPIEESPLEGQGASTPSLASALFTSKAKFFTSPSTVGRGATPEARGAEPSVRGQSPPGLDKNRTLRLLELPVYGESFRAPSSRVLEETNSLAVAPKAPLLSPLSRGSLPRIPAVPRSLLFCDEDANVENAGGGGAPGPPTARNGRRVKPALKNLFRRIKAMLVQTWGGTVYGMFSEGRFCSLHPHLREGALLVKSAKVIQFDKHFSFPDFYQRISCGLGFLLRPLFLEQHQGSIFLGLLDAQAQSLSFETANMQSCHQLLRGKLTKGVWGKHVWILCVSMHTDDLRAFENSMTGFPASFLDSRMEAQFLCVHSKRVTFYYVALTCLWTILMTVLFLSFVSKVKKFHLLWISPYVVGMSTALILTVAYLALVSVVVLRMRPLKRKLQRAAQGEGSGNSEVGVGTARAAHQDEVSANGAEEWREAAKLRVYHLRWVVLRDVIVSAILVLVSSFQCNSLNLKTLASKAL